MSGFFIGGTNLFGGQAFLSAGDTAKVKALFRKGAGYVRIEGPDGTACTAEPSGHMTVAPDSAPPEPSVSCTVYLALTAEDVLLSSIRRAVELGAAGIVVYPAAGSEPAGRGGLPAAAAKWQAAADQMAGQARRRRRVRVTFVSSFAAAVELAAGAALPLFLYEEEQERSLGRTLREHPDAKTVSLLIGPRAGFSPQEAALAGKQLLSVSLGPRQLCCDTAAAAALALILCAADCL